MIWDAEMGRPVLAHRASWKIHHGDNPPDDLFVLHLCDNPKCVRPDHLRIGTNEKNMREARAKGNLAGQFNGRAKLTWQDVDDIQQRFLSLRRSIANEFGISEGAVKDLLARRRWNKVRKDGA